MKFVFKSEIDEKMKKRIRHSVMRNIHDYLEIGITHYKLIVVVGCEFDVKIDMFNGKIYVEGVEKGEA